MDINGGHILAKGENTMKQFTNHLLDLCDANDLFPAVFLSLLALYFIIRFLLAVSPKFYHLLEKYRTKRNEFINRNNNISQISNKLDRLSASVESLIDSSTSKNRELSEKIDVLFQNQEEIRRQQYEDKADNIRENILNFAERLRNHPDGEYSIEKFEQIFALGSKYKKIITENELTNDVFVHDYEYIEAQFRKRFNENT